MQASIQGDTGSSERERSRHAAGDHGAAAAKGFRHRHAVHELSLQLSVGTDGQFERSGNQQRKRSFRPVARRPRRRSSASSVATRSRTCGAITEIGEYLRAGGGKRLRPALLLLSCKLMDYSGRGAIQLGAVVEIIHTATLVHDDIIDEAQTRRGRPAANTQWGNSKCVLAGDWLYMQAFKIAVQERNFPVLDVLIDLTQQMVEGELLQIERLGKRSR